MPKSNKDNSSWNRRESLSADSELEQEFQTKIESNSTEEQDQSEFDSNSSDYDLEEYDFSLKLEDYAPAWFLKLRSLFGTDPEWLLASTFGVIAIILTLTLLIALPNEDDESLSTEIVAPEAAAENEISQSLFEPFDSRIVIEAPDPWAFVEVGTDSLLVSFGELQNSISGVVTREENSTQPDRPLKRPEFKSFPEPMPEPKIVMNIQKIRVIEREILDPNIDQNFFVKAKPVPLESHNQIDPNERTLFDQNWKLIDLVRDETQRQRKIRPTLYHERIPGGKHLQVGQERPFDRSKLDRLTRVTAPKQKDRLNLEIRKSIPQNGTAQNLLTYSILIKNQGTSPAYNVQVNETLAPKVSLVDVSPPAEVQQKNLQWKIARLDPDEERELQVKVFLNQEGRVKTNSKIRLASKVSTSTEIAAPKLTVEMKGPEVVTKGEVFPLDFIVSNQGKHTQHDFNLNLDLPKGFEHDQGRQLTLKIDQLAPRESRTFRARVKATQSGVLKSQAMLAAQGISFDPVELKQKVIEQKTNRAPTPTQRQAPMQSREPVQFCPCPPVYAPVLYLVP